MTEVRDKIEAIYRGAIAAVDPRTSVLDAVRTLDSLGVRNGSDGTDFYAIGVGKASPGMVQGLVEALPRGIAGGIVVSKEPPAIEMPNVRYLTGSHPVPDERSLASGKAALAFAHEIPAGATTFCLISGGGSALVEYPSDGVSLADIQQVTTSLLARGATIQELNAVRSRLSEIKGGGLLRALEHTQVINFMISDVLGDDLSVIASGATVSPASQLDADAVLEQHGIKFDLPPKIRKSMPPPISTSVVGNNSTALTGATACARHVGLRPAILTERLEGEAREIGRVIAAILADRNHRDSPVSNYSCVLAGGETTVTVSGNGVGGRNTEAALAAALQLEGIPGITVGFLATDGDDGLSGAAGAIVSGATITAETRATALEALARNDSYTFLHSVGAAWSPGATGTNVNDLIIAVMD